MSRVSKVADPVELRTARWAAALLALALPAAALAHDSAVSATLGATGQRALASAAGIDARNSGSVRVALPENPAPSFHAKLSAPISQPPVADARGRLLVAHGAGKLSQLDAAGRLEWSVRVGPDSEASAPVIARDETRWLITQAGEAVGFDARGGELYREGLPGLIETKDIELVPLASGGLALASARQIAELDRRGKIRWLGQAKEPVGSVLEARGALVAVTNGGQVLRRDAEGNLSALGELGGRVSSAAVAPDQRRLFAIVDHDDLLELDLATGQRRTLFSDAALPLSSLAVGARGEVRLVASGRLLGFDDKGTEVFRALVSSGAWPGGAVAALPLVDSQGATAINLPDAGLVLVKANGEVQAVAGSACPEPLRPTPIGARRLALSCRSGLVFGVSDRAP
jgi:outer membrane protein assembly factor BamB